MAEAKQGDKVSVHYTGKLEDGTVFDSSTGGDPLTFTLGQGQIIPGFEQAVVGMSPEETKTAKIDAKDAYGAYRDDLVIQVERSRLPDDMDPEVGDELEVRQPDDSTIRVTVREVGDDKVSLDANHPLAGQDLIFDIELVEIAQ